MPIKGVLFLLIVVALILRTSTPIKRGYSQTGFQDFEQLIEFIEAEDTGFLGLYVLYNEKKSRNLERCEELWHKRCLILMLFLIAGIEQNPGEFMNITFMGQRRTVLVKTQKNISQFTIDHPANRNSIRCIHDLQPNFKIVLNEILKVSEFNLRLTKFIVK